MPPPSSPDIDRILEAIRTEARARGSKGRVGSYSTDIGGTVRLASYGLPRLETRHVADFLALPMDEFFAEAYRQVLGREPDASGLATFQRAMLRGRFTRIEVMGRLWLSAEGRRRGTAVPGLGLAFAIATLYRIPVAGPLAAVAARALKLPAHWQDRSGIESTALATGAWMKR